jgi:hypothetical protein
MLSQAPQLASFVTSPETCGRGPSFGAHFGGYISPTFIDLPVSPTEDLPLMIFWLDDWEKAAALSFRKRSQNATTWIRR